MKRIFTAENSLASIIVLIREGAAFLKENEVSPRALYIGELALEETLTNIVKYAYADQLAHQIEVTAEIDNGHVRLEFSDDGLPFDPLAAAPPKFGEPLTTQPMGGRGIHLVKTFVKEASYRREGDRNLLTLVFPSKAP